ncbi:MAG: hypothetical protein CMO44_13105 [Verrucomicrobiales bacterium]|nr:hypothetical protein [Verrucomicrobiales bacterium]|tara:strand:+ start:28964 stop:29350 length:387 start_codon:yes stop_codon:yes gene_type:complete
MNLFTLILVVLGMVAFVALLSMVTSNSMAERTRIAGLRLVEQSGKMIANSKQDTNLLFAVLDSTAAVSYAEALTMISSDDNIQRVYKTSPIELLENAKEEQKNAIKNLGREYPSLLPDQEDAIVSGWI